MKNKENQINYLEETIESDTSNDTSATEASVYAPADLNEIKYVGQFNSNPIIRDVSSLRKLI